MGRHLVIIPWPGGRVTNLTLNSHQSNDFRFEFYQNGDVPAFIEDFTENNKSGVISIITLMNKVVSHFILNVYKSLDKNSVQNI